MRSTVIPAGQVPARVRLYPPAFVPWPSERKPTDRSPRQLLRTVWLGIKRQLALVGRSGIVPISHSQDTAGPLARTVREMLQSCWPQWRSRGKLHGDYLKFS